MNSWLKVFLEIKINVRTDSVPRKQAKADSVPRSKAMADSVPSKQAMADSVPRKQAMLIVFLESKRCR